jgi:hypothetical protein
MLLAGMERKLHRERANAECQEPKANDTRTAEHKRADREAAYLHERTGQAS